MKTWLGFCCSWTWIQILGENIDLSKNKLNYNISY
jgi:hypothetical protein